MKEIGIELEIEKYLNIHQIKPITIRNKQIKELKN